MNIQVHTWFERDRASVEVRDDDTDTTIIEWIDEDVWQAVENGFLEPGDYENSALDYAIQQGLIKESDLNQTDEI